MLVGSSRQGKLLRADRVAVRPEVHVRRGRGRARRGGGVQAGASRGRGYVVCHVGVSRVTASSVSL